MSFFRKCLIWLLYWPIRILVKPHTIPADVTGELDIDPARPIMYLLHTDSVADQLALAYSAKKLGLPSPLSPVKLQDTQHPACLFLHSPKPLFTVPTQLLKSVLTRLRRAQTRWKTPAWATPLAPTSPR